MLRETLDRWIPPREADGEEDGEEDEAGRGASMRRLFRAISVFGLASTAPLLGQGSLESESLAGLDRIHVVVREPGEQAKEGGLDRRALEAFLFAKLRDARVPVVSRTVPQISRRRPYLQLEVDVLSQGPRAWVYALNLRLYQRTCIRDFPSHGSRLGERGGCLATATWEWFSLGVARSWLRRAVQEELSVLIDRFATDYFAANP